MADTTSISPNTTTASRAATSSNGSRQQAWNAALTQAQDQSRPRDNVEICCRPAQIAGGLIDHCWVKTSTKSAGMGANPDIPPGQQYEGLGMPVQITDHSKDTATYCVKQNNVDEKCVNDKLQIGEPIGRFLPPLNQCQSFAYGTVNSCRTGPQAEKPR